MPNDTVFYYQVYLTLFLVLKSFTPTYCACGGSNSPYLIQDADFRRIIVKEDEPINSVLIKIKCKDVDGDACVFGLEPLDAPNNLFYVKTLTFTEAELILRGKLDRETKSSYSFYLTVSDNPNDPSCKIKSLAYLYVEDVNDESPKFIDLKNPIDVLENTPLGSNLLNITATDSDSSYYGAITFELYDLDNNIPFSRNIQIYTHDKPYFKLENLENNNPSASISDLYKNDDVQHNSYVSLGSSPYLKLIRELDYEAKKIHKLLLVARDGGSIIPISETRTTNVTLIINVRDVQDSPPKFLNTPYVFTIPENLPPESVVFIANAIDGDMEVPNNILYSILRDDEKIKEGMPKLEIPFRLHKHNGQLIVNEHLDREQFIREYGNAAATYYFTIRAEEDSYEKAYAEASVIITLDDVNDFSPQFNFPRFYGNINENSVKFTSVIIDYHSQDSERPLNESPSNGQYLVPLFTDTRYKYGNGQNLRANHYRMADLVIKDLDQGKNSIFNISLIGKYSNYFMIDPPQAIKEVSPVIRILEPSLIDREKLSNITLKIRATEVFTKEKYESQAEIFIQINDMNDEIPYFIYPTDLISSVSNTKNILERFYSLNISENANIGEKLFKVQARDDDTEEEHSTIYYSKLTGKGSENFDLHPISGWITLKNQLDREAMPFFSLTIEINDGGYEYALNERQKGNVLSNKQENSQSKIYNRATTNIEITVDDVNDNPPIFIQHKWIAFYVEGRNDFRQSISLKALDADQPGNPSSDVRYRFQIQSLTDKKLVNYFNLDFKTGLLMPNSINSKSLNLSNNEEILDFESIYPLLNKPGNNVSLKVEAFDLGTPSLSTTCHLIITIEDANDNPPIFAQTHYILEIPENTNSDEIIANITATDGDIYTSYNSLINYFLVEQYHLIPNELFSFEANTINSKRSPSQSFSEDNINSPKFWINPQTGALSLFPGTKLDVDQRWAKTSNNIFSKYSLDLWGKQNSSTEFTYTVFVYAKDRGIPPLISNNFVTIEITIKDINDEDPKFLQNSYQAVILENSVPGTFIKMLDSSTKSLSYSQSLYQMDINNYKNGVRAIDTDKNAILKYDIIEYLEAYDYKREPISLKDGDLGLEFKKMFNIDPYTGNIYVSIYNFGLDREKIETLKVRIRARDVNSTAYPDDPKLVQSDYAVLTIHILDVNDNKPDWKPSSVYKSKIFENPSKSISKFSTQQTSEKESLEGYSSKYSNEIIQVNAIDRDTNNSIKYSLDYESLILTDKDLIKIDPKTGIIYRNLPIDYERNQWINFTVIATDNGVPEYSSRAQIFIRILDLNDNTPQFINLPKNPIHVTENIAIGSKLLTIQATDEDSGRFSSLYYYIKDGDEGMFKINHYTGEINVIGPIDRESKDTYKLIIAVRDNSLSTANYHSGSQTKINFISNPTYQVYEDDFEEFRENITTIIIKVDDVNDNAPKFTTINYHNHIETQFPDTLDKNEKPDYKNILLVFKETVKAGEILYEFTAEDSDLENTNNSRINYIINPFSGNGSSLIDLNSETGILRTKIDFNTTILREMNFIKYVPKYKDVKSYFYFAVMAKDMGIPVLSSITLNVTLAIEDINDNIPSIEITTPTFNYDLSQLSDNIHTIIKNQDIFVYFQNDSTLLNKETDILNVIGSDNDIGLNARMTYSLSSSFSTNDLNYFKINPISGVLSFKTTSTEGEINSINMESITVGIKNKYQILLEVKDSGHPSLSSNLPITIYFINNNDKPMFEKAIYKIDDIYENTLPGYIGKIPEAIAKFRDPKLSPHLANPKLGGTIQDKGQSLSCYYISAGDPEGLFTLDPFTRSLFLNKSLDRELKPTHVLVVQVTNDCANIKDIIRKRKNIAKLINTENLDVKDNELWPSKEFTSSGLKVIINIQDINDNYPVFKKKFYRTGITTDSKIGTILHIPLEYEDKDSPENSLPQFSLLQGDQYIQQNSYHTTTTAEDLLSTLFTGFAHNDLSNELGYIDNGHPPSTLSNETSTYLPFQETHLAQKYTSIEKRLERSDDIINFFEIDKNNGQIKTAISFKNFKDNLEANNIFDEYNDQPITTTSINNDSTKIPESEALINFRPTNAQKFDFKVRICDNEDINYQKCDFAIVQVYLLSPDEQVKFVVNMPVVLFKSKKNKFNQVLVNITGFEYIIDEIRIHSLETNHQLDSMTDVIGHFLSPYGMVIGFNHIVNVLDASNQNFAELKSEFDIEKITKNVYTDIYLPLKQNLYWYRISFYISTICLFITVVIVIALWIPERKKYRRKLRAATAASINTKNDSIYRQHTALTIPHINNINRNNLNWLENNNKLLSEENQDVDRHSKISSSEIWNNISNPSLYSRNNSLSSKSEIGMKKEIKNLPLSQNLTNSQDTSNKDKSILLPGFNGHNILSATNKPFPMANGAIQGRENLGYNLSPKRKNNAILQKINLDIAEIQKGQIDDALIKRLTNSNA